MDTKTLITPADRITKLPKYIFVELDEMKCEAKKNGIEFIDLGIGNPDGCTAEPIVEAAIRSIKDPKSHGYPAFRGKKELKDAIAGWMKSRYDVTIDPENEIQVLTGAKEGLALTAFAFTNPGDINIVPDPYYPVLARGTWASGGETYHIPLLPENNFLPDIDAIPDEVAEKAKLFIINYPNNPTGAVAPREFLEKVVAFCRKHSILLLSDLAYGEVCFGDYRPLSIFNIEGAKEIAVEIHSWSKTFNMAGWRAGFVTGRKEFIEAIFAMKTNLDYGTPTVVQDAATKALQMDYSYVVPTMKKYERRRDILVEKLRELGWEVEPPKATMYFWLPTPNNMPSMDFCKKLLKEAGVVVTPGIAFGQGSDKYFRLSTVQPEELLIEAMERMKKAGIRYQ